MCVLYTPISAKGFGSVNNNLQLRLKAETEWSHLDHCDYTSASYLDLLLSVIGVGGGFQPSYVTYVTTSIFVSLTSLTFAAV